MKKQSLHLLGCIIGAMGIQAQVRIISTLPINATTPAASNVIIGNSTYTGIVPADNTFVGNNVGSSANTGGANTFVGQGVGFNNTAGLANTFIGAWTGASNTTGSTNTFIGQFCGYYNRTGNQNTFVGQNAGELNSIGSYNTFLGKNAGRKSLADGNTFLGYSTGINTDLGRNNSFFGVGAGNANITGSNNLALGTDANFTKPFFEYATAIGSGAIVDGSNAMVLGGTDLVTPRTNVNVGIGTTSPTANLHLEANIDNELILVNTTKNNLVTAYNMRAGQPAVLGNPNDLLITLNGPTANMPIGGYGLYTQALPSIGLAPLLPWENLAMLATKQSPLYIGTYQTQTNNYAQNIHFVTGVDTSYPKLPKILSPWECIRINKADGFVGIHTRTAATAGTTAAPQALFHVNLTNPANARLNRFIQGIRFEGLPAANHPDVVVIDALGNLATRPYNGIYTMDCDSIIKCAWGLRGNTVVAGDYIGTNNADDFRYRTNGTQRGRVTVDGNWDFGNNSFTTATTASAMGNNNFIGNSISALAAGANNRIGSTLGSDYATAVGYLNTINGSYAASALGAKNDILNNSLFASALGTINVLDNAEAAHVVGSNNTILNSISAIAMGGLNKIDQSGHAFTVGENNLIQGNSDRSASIGEANEITASEGAFAAGFNNRIIGSNKGTIVLGAKNIASNSNESAILGEDNHMANGHGTIVGGGHNYSEGPYNIVLGEHLHASTIPTTPPPTPLPDKHTGIMLIGDQLNSTLTQSLSVGFNANRTMVVNKRGVAIQMNPSSGSTFSPTHNLIVDADPSIGGTGVGSNIAFKNLPLATYPMPIVLVDSIGELYQTSISRALRVSSNNNHVIADSKIEKNIQPISNALGIINQIEPKQFTIDATQYPSLGLLSGKNSYGFVAQELEKVLPTLISEVPIDEGSITGKNNETIKGVNYMEMIPLLVQALKEQQVQINSQQRQIEALLAKENPSNELLSIEKEALATIRIQLSDADIIMLQQNVPNPGDRFTAIGFNIPVAVKSASLVFANGEGKTIKTVMIAARGKGVFNLYTSGLSRGVYTYTLLVDGKMVDTKQMIIGR